MKKRLNILCILIFITLGASLYTKGYIFGMGIHAGISIAKERREIPEQSKEAVFAGDLRIVDLIPSTAVWKPDSIINAKSGESLSVVHTQMAVRVGKGISYPYVIVNACCSLIGIASGIAALIFFILLILDINRSQIFEWKNVRRLRWLGGLLIVFFACYLIPQIANYRDLKEILALDKYIITPYAIELTDLLLGLACLVVAESFSIGLKIKEEQELTI